MSTNLHVKIPVGLVGGGALAADRADLGSAAAPKLLLVDVALQRDGLKVWCARFGCI